MADRLRTGRPAVVALAAIAGVTALWWALALWPLTAEAPGWVARARYVCFGSPPDGLPDAAGWLVLVGQPLGMVGLLVAIWGQDLRLGLAGLGRSVAGRLALAGGVVLLLGMLGFAGARVVAAGERFDPGSFEVPGTLAPLDRPAPPLALVDQAGDTIRLERFRGRPVLVTFAFAHCQTVCPTVVRTVLDVQRAEPDRQPAVVILTLDPWRDTPARLPALASAWALGADAHLLGGGVPEVEAALDAWGVARTRDTLTGEVHHPVVVFVVGPDGRLAFAVPAYPEAIRQALVQLPARAGGAASRAPGGRRLLTARRADPIVAALWESRPDGTAGPLVRREVVPARRGEPRWRDFVFSGA